MCGQMYICSFNEKKFKNGFKNHNGAIVMLEKKVVIQSTVVVEWLIILHFKYEVSSRSDIFYYHNVRGNSRKPESILISSWYIRLTTLSLAPTLKRAVYFPWLNVRTVLFWNQSKVNKHFKQNNDQLLLVRYWRH